MSDPWAQIAAASRYGADRKPLFPEFPGVELTEADVMAPENALKTLWEVAQEKFARLQEEEEK